MRGKIRDALGLTKLTSNDTETIRKKVLSIFYILKNISWAKLNKELARHFLESKNKSMTDADLPVSDEQLEFLDRSSRSAFIDAQYLFALFVIDERGDPQILCGRRLLPFASTPQKIGSGSYSIVYSVLIPNRCYKNPSNNQACYNDEVCPTIKPEKSQIMSV